MYKRYDRYKDSGIEWIGEIPEGWKIKAIKHLCVIIMGQSPNSEDCNIKQEGLPFLQGNAEFGDIHPTPKQYCIQPNKKAEKGDILLSVRAPVGALNIANQKYGIGRGLCAIRVDSLEKDYTWYLMHGILNELYIMMTGSTYDAVSVEDVKNVTAIVPKRNEQYSIGAFLNFKTSEIDSLIADKEKLIEKLEEYKQSIITEAVTKGLNPDVKMKDSGIEWIGEIPEHWVIKRIKHTTYVKGRIGWHGLRSDEFIEEGPYLVTGTDFIDGVVNWNNCYHISDERYIQAPEIQLKEDDLLITKDGSIGKVAMVKNKPDKAILNSGIFVTRPKYDQYINKYMYWMLKSSIFDKYIKYMELGSTIKHLYQSTFENFSFPLPDKEEQKKITMYLDEINLFIERCITDINAQNDSFKTYRQSLIYEAVTGKIDVRDFEPQRSEQFA